MRKNKQLREADCLQACLTSILEIPNPPTNLGSPEDGVTLFKGFLSQFGLILNPFRPDGGWRQGYWIAVAKSKNFKDTPDIKYTHAIVMLEDRVAFDPSNKKRYRVGRELGKDKIKDGYYLEVVDASKLQELCKFKKNKSLSNRDGEDKELE